MHDLGFEPNGTGRLVSAIGQTTRDSVEFRAEANDIDFPDAFTYLWDCNGNNTAPVSTTGETAKAIAVSKASSRRIVELPRADPA